MMDVFDGNVLTSCDSLEILWSGGNQRHCILHCEKFWKRGTFLGGEREHLVYVAFALFDD